MSNEFLRKEKLSARKALSSEHCRQLSEQICRSLSALPEFQSAKNIMLYRAVPHEVQLDSIPDNGFAYPFCTSDSEMIALRPNNSRSWRQGRWGIYEPIPEHSTEVLPSDLDLVVCPCVAFDGYLSRLGMGKGFYDRFLSQCSNALFIALAFEVQKVDCILSQPWDIPMDIIITEKAIYR